jgi:pseudouridine-5'-phosphate glycosidase
VGGLVGTYRENIKNQLQSSLLVLNPVPEKDEILEEEMKNIISKSISKMDKLGIIGNKTTPFLLNEIAVKTKNKSLETNISLALNNIKLGAKIALKV